MPTSKRTVDQTPDYRGFPKAGELIEITGTGGLTLHDKRVFNTLVTAAWLSILDDVEHRIPIRDVRGNHKGKERVRDSVIALMKTVVAIPTIGRNGKPATIYTQLLTDTTVSDDDDDPTGEVVFFFPRQLRKVIAKSTHWGRIKSQIVYAFTSKYSLSLYELLSLRVNLEHKDCQTFDLTEFRALLGVPDDKLLNNSDLLRKAVQPAVLEVNGLSDIGCEVEPIRKGGTMRGVVSGFRVTWWRKSFPELQETAQELSRPKIGRLARLSGKAEAVAPEPVQIELEDAIAACGAVKR